MTTNRPEWYYGQHPPACTCVSCEANRTGHRPGRQVWRGRDITSGTPPPPSNRPAPTPPVPSGKGGGKWMVVALFLLGLAVGGGAVWWWTNEKPDSFAQVTEKVRQAPPGVGPLVTQQNPETSPTPTLVPVIVPTASPSPTPTLAPIATATPAPPPTPLPSPTPTLTAPQILYLMDSGKITKEEAAAMLERLTELTTVDSIPTTAPTPAAAATATPMPTIAPTPVKKLSGVDCALKCDWDFVPATSSVGWLQAPTVSDSGIISVEAQVGENDRLTLPGVTGGASNIAITNGRGKLYGFVIPPIPPGWTWEPAPGQWIADVYLYRNEVLKVTARINPQAAAQADLTLCLWTGGTAPNNRVLDCIQVKRP